MPTADDFLHGLLGIGDYARYGVSPEVKQQVASAMTPAHTNAIGQKYATPSDLADAERQASTALGSSSLMQRGAGPVASAALPVGFNLLREVTQGNNALVSGKPFFTPGGMNAEDPTGSDEDWGSGFNVRQLAAALKGTGAGIAANDPTAGLIAGLLRR